MLEDYIKKIVKEEIAKDNLNKQYGKNATAVYELYMKEQNLNKENESLKIILNEIYAICDPTWGQKLPYREIRSLLNRIRALSKTDDLIDEKEKIESLSYRELMQEIKKLKQENEKLKKENEILEKSIKNLGSTVSLKDNLLNEKNKEIEELNDLYEKEKNKNYKTLESLELKQKNEKLRKELRDSKNGLNGANDVIKNMKQENEKLKQKLVKISNVINSYDNRELSFYSLTYVMSNIQNILKES